LLGFTKSNPISVLEWRFYCFHYVFADNISLFFSPTFQFIHSVKPLRLESPCLTPLSPVIKTPFVCKTWTLYNHTGLILTEEENSNEKRIGSILPSRIVLPDKPIFRL